MKKLKVIKVDQEFVEFENGVKLSSYHESDCCESHYLSFTDLTSDSFFKRVEGYGIELIPIVGHPVRVPGYGHNNGYYSSHLDLIISDDKSFQRTFDISECQEINE